MNQWVLAGVVMFLAVTFAVAVLIVTARAERRSEALLKSMMDRTLPAPITTARSAPPPDTPEARAARVARGEYTDAEIREKALKLAKRFGTTPGTEADLLRETERLIRGFNGETD